MIHTIVGMKNRLHVGKNVKLQNTIFNVWSGEIIIGDYSFFGHNSCVVTGTHDIRLTDIKRQKAVPESGRDIFIGTSVFTLQKDPQTRRPPQAQQRQYPRQQQPL